jgi:hypothetical protein
MQTSMFESIFQFNFYFLKIPDAMASQLNSVRLKLEQRRKRIEEEKRKMELVMARQREKVGQQAFLRAVIKGVNTNTTNKLTILTRSVDHAMQRRQ